MAKLCVVSVYDIAAQTYQRPMFVPAAGAATRWFGDHVNRGDKDDPMCLHPEHFQLFHLGFWDDYSSEWDCFLKPELLVTGSAVVSGKQ